ncbi:MAG: AMP-binding protein [Akkermansia sp.]|nr:AMP-binding protein [Akkermansia sp.]
MMNTALKIHGQENIETPGFYMPNRFSIAAGKALYDMLGGQLCYLVDPSFSPAQEMLDALRAMGARFEYFDFRNTTPRDVREQILTQLNAGVSVVFLPGKVANIRGTYSDVPSPFLRHVGRLHIAPIPLFLGYYGDTIKTLYRERPDTGCHEEFCVLPKLAAGPQTGERLMAAWLEKGAEVFSAQPMLETSLTTNLVKAMKAYPTVEVIDGMSGSVLPNFKALGVSMAVAKMLRKRPDKRIGVILPPGAGGVIATLSCLLAGVTPVMINYATSAAAFESTVRQAGLTTFITARKFMQKLPQFPWPPVEQLILVEDLLQKTSKLTLASHVLMAKMLPASVICNMYSTDARKGDDESVILFTSGSSGEPKGVVLTHRMVLANTAQCACRLDLTNCRFLASLPIFHSFGMTVTMILPILSGCVVCSYPNPTDARTLNELIVKHQLTLVCATPTFGRAMLRRAEADTFRSVRYFVLGAEKLQPDLEREFMEKCGVKPLEGYGLTETAPVIGANMPDAEPVEGTRYYVPGTVRPSIGAMLPGIAIRITDVDDDTRELPLTERGMIWFKGANVFSGYIGRPELNKEIFHNGWFKTGDIGQMDLNGFLTLGGRLSRFSKIGGEMVPHEGVEAALAEVFGLQESETVQIAIASVSDSQKGEALVLLSSMPEHQRSSEEKEILSSIRGALADMAVPTLWTPKYLVPVEAIPVLPTGKLDLRGCKLLAEEALCLQS